METASNTALLEAPLNALHEQSIEWLEEIEFWRDEVAFFYTLIIEKTKAGLPSMKGPEARAAEKKLIHISTQSLDELKQEVTGHEKFLARIVEHANLDQKLYRDRHQQITTQFTAFEKEFRSLKREIFALATGHIQK